MVIFQQLVDEEASIANPSALLSSGHGISDHACGHDVQCMALRVHNHGLYNRILLLRPVEQAS